MTKAISVPVRAIHLPATKPRSLRGKAGVEQLPAVIELADLARRLPRSPSLSPLFARVWAEGCGPLRPEVHTRGSNLARY
jgi:hypothetical protein